MDVALGNARLKTGMTRLQTSVIPLWRIAGWLGVALTLIISLTPAPPEPGGGHTDKIVHLSGYALLTFWWAQLILRQRWKLAVAVILFGLLIEGLQGLTATRQFDLLDALANTGGVLLGWLTARLLPNLPQRVSTLPARPR